MNYSDFIVQVASYSSLVLAIYFLFIVLFSSKQYKTHALIILAFSILGFATPNTINNSTLEYVTRCNISMLVDGATAITLTMFLAFDKLAWKQALLLAFAVLCHLMIIYDLTRETIVGGIFFLEMIPPSISAFFYSYYDELIITVGLLQMLVSYNGFIRALDSLQSLLHWYRHNSNSIDSGISTQKERGA